jgi:hypothetical protein
MSEARPGDRLEGWKQIAGYFNKDVRTVQLWEKKLGLPVQRHRGGGVWADPNQLKDWDRDTDPALKGVPAEKVQGPETLAPLVDAPPDRPKNLPWKWLLGATSLLMLGALGTAWMSGIRDSPPVPVPFSSDRLFARVAAEGGAIRHIPVGKFPVSVLLHPSRPDLYVLNQSSGNLSVIDADRLEARRPIPIGYLPKTMVLDPAGEYLYSGTQGQGLVRIDVRTGSREVFSHDGLTDGDIRGLAITADGKRLFLAMTFAGLKVMDLPEGTVRTISTVPAPSYLAIDPGGRYLFVSYQSGGPGGWPGHDTIEAIDLNRETPVGSFTRAPFVGGPLTAGTTLWANGLDGCTDNYAAGDRSGCPVIPGRVLYIFRPQDRSLIKALGTPLTEYLGPAAFTPDGLHVFTAGAPARVYHPSGMIEEETYPLQPSQRYQGSAFDVKRRRLYVADDAGSLDVIELPRAPCSASVPGLWNHWPGDGNPNDRKGMINAVTSGGLSYSPGLVGASFNLSSGRIEVRSRKHTSMGFFSGRPGAILFWFKPFSNGGKLAYSGMDGGLAGWTLESKPDGSLRLLMDGVTPITTGPLSPGSWHMVALVRTTSDITLLTDGRVAGSTQAPPEGTVGATSVHWGPVPALIDEILFFEMPLSVQEVQETDRIMRTCLTG